VRQKDGKDDQHHNTANVNDDLHGGHKFNLQIKIQGRHSHQRKQ
jgi:hypothetical protein